MQRCALCFAFSKMKSSKSAPNNAINADSEKRRSFVAPLFTAGYANVRSQAMTNYAVFLEGNDFELSRKGSKEALGFFVTVRVESQSEQEAVGRAIEIVKADPQLEEAFGATSKNPKN